MMSYTNYNPHTTSDKWAARVTRQVARAALTRPGHTDEYYDHYQAVLRETAPDGTAPAPQRMEKRTPGNLPATSRRTASHPQRIAAKAAQRMERKPPTDPVASMRWVLEVCDRTEVQIRSYPLARRLRHQRHIAELRAKAKANLRKLGYTNV